jgi:hypothetical protein
MKRAFSFLAVLVVIAAIVLLKQHDIISESLASALIGAIIPLAGVLWTIQYGYLQFREGLREDRKKTVDDRAYTAKQAAFMAATDAAAKFVNYLTTLPDSEPVPGKNAPEAEELTIALSKLHYYCGLETIKKCIEVGEAFSVSAAEVSKAKLESMFLAVDMKGVDVRLGGLQTMIDRLNAQIQAALQANPQDPQIAFWRGQLANFYGQSGELYRMKGELDLAKYRATEKCRDVMLAQLKGLYGLQVDLLILARRELEFKIPENEYLQLMRAQAQTTFAKMDELIGEIRAQVNKKLAGQTQAKPAQ